MRRKTTLLAIERNVKGSGACLKLLANERNVKGSGDASSVLLCHHCDNKSMPPRMSIANNMDFGLLSRIDFYFGPSFCASHFIIARCACRTAAMGTSLEVRAE